MLTSEHTKWCAEVDLSLVKNKTYFALLFLFLQKLFFFYAGTILLVCIVGPAVTKQQTLDKNSTTTVPCNVSKFRSVLPVQALFENS